MNRVMEIVKSARRTGNTTRILKSAMQNPNCIILCKDQNQSKELESQYKILLMNSVWYKKLYWKFFGRNNPKFTSIGLFIPNSHSSLPIIFDNSALL